MNPLEFMQLKPMLEKFKQNHPKVPKFFTAASNNFTEDSIIEIKVTSPDGQSIITNMKVNSDDLALIAELKKMLGKKK